MTQIFESVTVTISKREYAELIQKAFAYDAYKKSVKENKAKGLYISAVESALFLTDDVIDILDVMRDIGLKMGGKPEEDEPEEFFTDEEWEEVTAIAEEEEEDNATETV